VDDYVIDGDLAFTNTRAALKFYQEQYHKKKEWVGLTDEEIENCFEMSMFGTCRAIEAKLKEKNAA
jgi:hypothetical protein